MKCWAAAVAVVLGTARGEDFPEGAEVRVDGTYDVGWKGPCFCQAQRLPGLTLRHRLRSAPAESCRVGVLHPTRGLQDLGVRGVGSVVQWLKAPAALLPHANVSWIGDDWSKSCSVFRIEFL